MLDQRLAPTPPFYGLQPDRAERTLRCAYGDAVEPYLVHHHSVKPWLEPTHHGVYSQLLRRLLIGDDLAIRVPERAGAAAAAKRARAYVGAQAHQRARALSLARVASRCAARRPGERAVVKAAFYCVADERYFLGAVGLINSLRLVGHTEPIYLLDCGLTERPARAARAGGELVDAPADAPPTLLKTIAPLQPPGARRWS